VRLPPVGELLGQSWRRFARWNWQLLGLAVPVVAAEVVIQLLLVDRSEQLGVVSVAVGFVLTSIASGLIVAGLAPAGTGFEAPLSRSLEIAGRVLPAGLVAGIGLAIGFVLFIVPGLILYTRWSVLVPVLIREDIGWAESFGRSWALTRGNGWTIFGALLLVLVAYVALFLFAALFGGVTYVVVAVIVGAIQIAFSAVLSLVIYEGLVGTGAGVT
jgi:hypothetical protein